MKMVWKFISGIFAVCGIIAYLLSWANILSNSTIIIPTDFLMQDALVAGVFAIFFGIWGMHVDMEKKK